MNILIAPNAFKGSLTAFEVADIIRQNLLKINSNFNCICLPIADGGDGTFDVLTKSYRGKKYKITSVDLLDRKIQAPLFISEKKTAIIELAHVAGISLLKASEYKPLDAHTFGVGDLILHALNKNCTKIILAIGGSGTLDMGFGALRALGFRFLNKDGKEQKGGGGNLKTICKINTENVDDRLFNVDFKIACDVDNALLGEFGAAHVFGRQKGASPQDIYELNKNHQYFVKLIEKQFHINISKIKYGGAAGGFAAVFYALCGAKLQSGSELVFDSLNIDRAIKECDILITGEGQIDSQSLYGKAPYVLAKKAKRMGKRVVAFCGSAENLIESPFDSVVSIKKQTQNIDEAIKYAKANLSHAVLDHFYLF